MTGLSSRICFFRIYQQQTGRAVDHQIAERRISQRNHAETTREGFENSDEQHHLGPATPWQELDTAAVQGSPHDYGLAVVLLDVVDHLAPPEQVVPLRDAVQRFLSASYLDAVDKRAAQREFAALRTLAPRLPEPLRTLLDSVNGRDVGRLGPLLLPHVASHVEAAALSPSRAPTPTAPVFLLHGRHDTVIPGPETIGFPHFFSIRTDLDLGPRVTRTASAMAVAPRSTLSRASE